MLAAHGVAATEPTTDNGRMNIALWAVAVILALVFVGAGLLKATQPKAKVIEGQPERMAWMTDFSQGQIRLIGIAEVLGAVGLVVPQATGIAPILTPIAALLLGLMMLGAAAVHHRRGESDAVTPPIALALLSIFVAIGRFAG